MDHENSKVEYVLRHVTGKLGSVDASTLLNDAYDDTYGLYGSEAQSEHPFLPVASHKTEDVHNTSQFIYYLKRYRDYHVHKFYGISFIEFMSLPRFEAEAILKECTLAKKSDNQAMSELENELKHITNR